MSIPLGEGIVLGVIQGITEFLPISSDGHLALAQKLYGDQADLSLTVLLHAGTLMATLLVLRKRVWMAIEEGVRGIARPALWRDTPGGRDAIFVVVATIPTGLIGLGLKSSIERWSDELWIIGLGFLGSAVAVGSTKLVRPQGRTKLVPSLGGAVLVGLAQGSAVLPGLSRSGMTIASLLWLGVTAERAFELSFLVSLPAIAGAVLLEARHAFHGAEGAGILLFGTFISFVVGVGALLALKRVLASGKIHWFASYLVPVATATLAWGYARP
jgi:undecaprenyl-diphosphatase